MDYVKGTEVVSMLYLDVKGSGFVRPGDIGMYVSPSKDDARRSLIKWPKLKVFLATLNTQFHPRGDPPAMPLGFEIHDIILYSGDNHKFSERAQLITDSEGIILGPSIDDSDAKFKQKIGKDKHKMTLKRHHSVSILFPYNQKAVNVRTNHITKSIPLQQASQSHEVQELSSTAHEESAEIYVNTVIMNHSLYAQPDKARKKSNSSDDCKSPGTPKTPQTPGTKSPNSSASPKSPTMVDGGDGAFQFPSNHAGEQKDKSKKPVRHTYSNVIVQPGEVYGAVQLLGAKERDRRQSIIHVQETEQLYGSHEPQPQPKPELLEGTAVCAYEGVRKCRNRNANGSYQCVNHTCSEPYCYEPKSSSSSHCQKHEIKKAFSTQAKAL